MDRSEDTWPTGGYCVPEGTHLNEDLLQRAGQGTSGGNYRKMIFFSTSKNFLILEPLKKKRMGWRGIAFSLSDKLFIIEGI